MVMTEMADDRNAVENQVRRRLTEAAAAGGVPHSRASLEVLYLLPESFLREWVALFDAALKLPDSPAGKGVKDGELGKAGSGGGTLRGTHKGLRTDSSVNAGDAPHLGGGAPKKGPGGWHVKSTRALEIKGRMDKRLRNMAREIRRELAGEVQDGAEKGGMSVLACSGCGRMAQREWNWCPNCGGRFPQ
jgi:hypothetical protein